MRLSGASCLSTSISRQRIARDRVGKGRMGTKQKKLMNIKNYKQTKITLHDRCIIIMNNINSCYIVADLDLRNRDCSFPTLVPRGLNEILKRKRPETNRRRKFDQRQNFCWKTRLNSNNVHT